MTQSSAEVEMLTSKSKANVSAFLILGLATAIGHAQQPSAPTSGGSTTGAANALTGGAEGTTTDRGTSGAARPGAKAPVPTSGSSNATNAMTGGAEGSPTDKGTPARSGVTSPNAAGPAGASSSTGSQPDKK